MITKLIAIAIIVLVLFGGYGLYSWYKSVENEDAVKKTEAAAKLVAGDRLSGMSNELQPSLTAAQQAGPKAFANWLASYGAWPGFNWTMSWRFPARIRPRRKRFLRR